MAQVLPVAERELTTTRTPLADDAPSVMHRGRVIAASVLAGLLVTLLWSFEFVDSTIGDNVANNVLGYNAKARTIDGTTMAVVFAFVPGVGGSFTACNVAVFSALAPLSRQQRSTGDVLRPLVWLMA